MPDLPEGSPHSHPPLRPERPSNPHPRIASMSGAALGHAASRDSRATTCHGGCLVSHPSRWQSWALGVPTLVSCYSAFILMSLYRLQDRWIRILPCSRIRGWLYASLSLAPGTIRHLLHADSCPSYRDPPFHAPIVSLSRRPCTLKSYK